MNEFIVEGMYRNTASPCAFPQVKWDGKTQVADHITLSHYQCQTRRRYENQH